VQAECSDFYVDSIADIDVQVSLAPAGYIDFAGFVRAKSLFFELFEEVRLPGSREGGV